MRDAQAKDHWRRLYSRRRENQILAVSANRSIFPQSATLIELPPLTVICGGNGAGKSSIMALIHSALIQDVSGLPVHLQNGEISLTVKEGRDTWELKHNLSESPTEGRPTPFSQICWIDSASEAEAARRRFLAEPDLKDLLAQFGAQDLTAPQLALVQYVARKAYERVTVVDVEPESSVDGLSNIDDDEQEESTASIPFFEVVDSGVTYDSRTMGAGELAALSILWKFFSVPADSVILVEEPETHVSPSSQRQLLNVIARIANERSLSVIVSTHSVEMLHLVPAEAIRIAEPSGASIELRQPQSLHEVRMALGSAPSPARLVIVEDRLALVVLHELLASSRILEALGADISYAGSNSNAVQTARLCGQLKPPLPAVAVVDGDQRGSLRDCLYLPGETAPEIMLINAITAKKNGLSLRIGRTASEISTALTHARGQDPHEAWHELFSRLNVNSESLVRAAIQVWLTIPGSRPATRALAVEIERVLDEGS